MSEANDDHGPGEALSDEAHARRNFLFKLFLPVAAVGALVGAPASAQAQSLFNAIINNIRFPVIYRNGPRYGGRGRRHHGHGSRHRRVASRSRSSSSKSSSRAEPKSLD